ncbi:FAD/NAD-P-binding domain-containing protein [Clavulina sp. PMI_390]|nr:FAD/NAD-P-binding domain-containing protein [Clavulina sp. PMI_390]
MEGAPPRRRQVAVIGAGPVGCLAALALAKLGCLVTVYDARPDMRLPSSKAELQRRSVNLAISARGLAALEFVDTKLAARFLESAIPMRGRIIHDSEGTHMQVYDPIGGQCINSIDRGLLNERLLDEVAASPLITVQFQHKLTTVDFDQRILSFESKANGEAEKIEATFDLCIGADGSYSNVRRQMMRVVSMNYEQEYIPHGYVELRIPAGEGSTPAEPRFRLDPNGLHIWPRHSFMLIALPNKDGSFTSTLFAPREEFSRLKDRDSILQWFQNYFPDAVSLIGESNLVHDLMSNPRNSLISIKANPYHYKGRVILLGDAAHSMVPFYGQGLNCGLEDVRVLASTIASSGLDVSSLVDENGSSLGMEQAIENILEQYTQTRHADLVAICDLAMQNYVEMRHSVTTVSYRVRRTLDAILSRIFPAQLLSPDLFDTATSLRHASTSILSRGTPSGWLSLYTMVTFRPDVPYAVAKAKAEWQNQVISRALVGLGIGIGGVGLGLGWLAFRFGKRAYY